MNKSTSLEKIERIARLGHWEQDLKTGELTWSDGVFQIFGLKPQDGRLDFSTFAKMIHPDDRELIIEQTRLSLANHDHNYEVEYRILTPDGSIRFAHERAEIVYAEDGAPEKLFGFVHDVTKRTRAERELNQKSDELRERVKELHCLYLVSKITDRPGVLAEEILRETVDLIPPAWKYPKITRARISVAGKSYTSLDFMESEWKQSSDIVAGGDRIGSIDLFYIEKKPELDEGPFLKEERNLLDELAVRLGNAIDRIHAKEKLIESEERFRSVTQSASDAIISAGTDGLIMSWNVGAVRMFGYSEAEALGEQLEILMPEQYKGAHQKGFSRKVKTGVSTLMGKTVELEGLRKSDEKFPLELSLSSWETSKGIFFSAIIRDITERRRVEEERYRLATAIEQTSEMVIITDNAGTMLYVNPAFEKITGYTSAEAIGLTPAILKSGKQDGLFYKGMWETITKGNVWNGRMVNRKKSGEMFDEVSTITPIRDNAGLVTGYVAVKRDVTRETILEKELKQSQKLKAIGTMAGGIAHDFNNILMPIIGYTQIIKEKIGDNPEVLELLSDVITAGRRAQELVKSILTFSRRSEQSFRPVELHSLVKESIKLMRATIPTTVKIESRIDPDSGAVMGDHSQLHQVIVNLLTNAGYAMRERGGLLTVELKPVALNDMSAENKSRADKSHYVKLTVSDTGAGMETETLDRIFEPFFTTKPEGEGTGMGLSVLHGIAENHGGFVEVMSQSGTGSTFSVYLPRFDKSARTEDNIRHPSLSGRGRALVIDDQPAVAKTVSRILTHFGYEATTLTDSQKALKLFRDDPCAFDFVITDMTMPGISGEGLAREIHKLSNDIPIIMMTGYSDTIDMETAGSFGIRALLQKPLTPDKLGEVVRRELARRPTPAIHRKKPPPL